MRKLEDPVRQNTFKAFIFISDSNFHLSGKVMER